MNSKIVKPEGAPEWFKGPMEARVWDSEKDDGRTRVLVWFDREFYCPWVTSNGMHWRYAEPIESWVPGPDEVVAVVTQWPNAYSLKVFPAHAVSSLPRAGGVTTTVVSLRGNDGTLIDLGRSVEEILEDPNTRIYEPEK